MKLGFIGAGKVGSAMAILLKQAGYAIAGVASRSQTSARKLALRLGVSVFTPKELSYKSNVFLSPHLTMPSLRLPQTSPGKKQSALDKSWFI